MLVLSRKTNQSLFINDDIEVVVLEIRQNVVRIGINAPRTTAVLRSELRERIASMDSPRLTSIAGEGTVDPQELQSLTDSESNQLLHSFCERRRFWRTVNAIETTREKSAKTEQIEPENGLCFG